MTRTLLTSAAAVALTLGSTAYGGDAGTRTFRGVVTYYLIPAKVMRVNRIVTNPEPGSSYIGDDSILVAMDENMDVRANWTVVDVEYRQYPEPRVIEYELFSEKHRIEVKYQSVQIDIKGNISEYIPQ